MLPYGAQAVLNTQLCDTAQQVFVTSEQLIILKRHTVKIITYLFPRIIRDESDSRRVNNRQIDRRFDLISIVDQHDAPTMNIFFCKTSKHFYSQVYF